MGNDRHFSFKKAQIENFLKTEFKKKFKSNAKISLRKRHKFIDEVTCKIAKRFGKNVLVLIDFSKNVFCSVVSPVETESTEKGKLIKSFSHPHVFYTSHSVDRFSERMKAHENCVIKLDAFFNEALSSYGENDGFLTCPDGVFAYDIIPLLREYFYDDEAKLKGIFGKDHWEDWFDENDDINPKWQGSGGEITFRDNIKKSFGV